MKIDPRNEAVAIQRIRRVKDGICVGIVYRWDNGDVTTLWIGEKCTDLVFDEILDRITE